MKLKLSFLFILAAKFIFSHSKSQTNLPSNTLFKNWKDNTHTPPNKLYKNWRDDVSIKKKKLLSDISVEQAIFKADFDANNKKTSISSLDFILDFSNQKEMCEEVFQDVIVLYLAERDQRYFFVQLLHVMVNTMINIVPYEFDENFGWFQQHLRSGNSYFIIF